MANPSDGVVLRLPDHIPPRPQLTYPEAWHLLTQGAQRAATTPFASLYIDKPSDGAVYLIYLQPGNPFPNDGIRYQDNETKMPIAIAPGRELEVHEIKYGFIPGSDQNASRVRRRYRINTGGPVRNLVLVHYTRGPSTLIQPALMNQPIRQYPLRMVNEPSIYVIGDKIGQKAYPNQQGQAHGGMPGPGGPMGVPGGGLGGGVGGPGAGGMGMGGPGGAGGGIQMQPAPGGMGGGGVVAMGGMGAGPGGAGGGPLPPQATMGMQMALSQQQAMVAQASGNMESLERMRERERLERERLMRERAQHAGGAPGARGPRPPGPRVDDDESGDEIDTISTRTLALTRYKRNHDWMNEVFMQAAFGLKGKQPPKPPFSTAFSQADLDSKVARLQTEIEALQSKGPRRRDSSANNNPNLGSTTSTSDANMDFSMSALSDSSMSVAAAGI